MSLADILILLVILIPLIAQIYVSISFSKYKKIKNSKKISGFEVAREILDNNSLSGIYVTETKGMFSDHYDSSRKVIRLSTAVFHDITIAASAIAAHEVGHAIQDKEGNTIIKFRGFLGQFINFAAVGGYAAIIIGALFASSDLLWAGTILEIIILSFQLITLPVEIEASEKAKRELKKKKLLTEKEFDKYANMLKVAAYTYIAGAFTTIIQVLKLVFLPGDNNRED